MSAPVVECVPFAPQLTTYVPVGATGPGLARKTNPVGTLPVNTLLSRPTGLTTLGVGVRQV